MIVMVRMEAVYEGDLHTSCRHGPSGAQLATDAPVDNQGRGESFSPTDLLVTALGSCMMTIMGIAARDRGWAMEGARVSPEKHMAEEPRRVARIAGSRRVIILGLAIPRRRWCRKMAGRSAAPDWHGITSIN